MKKQPVSHRDLDVYQRALRGYARIVELTARLPSSERFELVSQVRASARSVCSCMAEAWRKKPYPPAFASKLVEAESEAAETQTWGDIMLIHDYITQDELAEVIETYDHILAQFVSLRTTSREWKARPKTVR
jgi:four helix bundle protein